MILSTRVLSNLGSLIFGMYDKDKQVFHYGLCVNCSNNFGVKRVKMRISYSNNFSSEMTRC